MDISMTTVGVLVFDGVLIATMIVWAILFFLKKDYHIHVLKLFWAECLLLAMALTVYTINAFLVLDL